MKNRNWKDGPAIICFFLATKCDQDDHVQSLRLVIAEI